MQYVKTFSPPRVKDELINRGFSSFNEELKKIALTINQRDIIAKEPWVDVRAFWPRNVAGPIQDHVEYINNALEDGAGKTVLMPEGDFPIGGPLKFYDNTLLTGVSPSYAGTGGTRITLKNNSNCNMIENVDPSAGNRYIRIGNIYLNGNRANQTSGKGISFTKGKNATLFNLKFNNIYEEAIYLNQCKEDKIISIDTMNVDDGIYLTGSVDEYIAGGCQITTSNANYGILMVSGSDHNIVIGNFFFLCKHGVYLSGSHHNQIISNRSNTNDYCGIVLLDSNFNTLNANRAFNNGVAGDGARNGILLEGSSEGNVAVGNTCKNETGTNQQNGMAITGTAFDNIVLGNHLIGNANRPLLVTSTGWNLIDNNLGRTGVLRTFGSTDATPAVDSSDLCKTNNEVPTTITMFDEGVKGQKIKVLFGDGNTTIDFTDTNLKGNAGVDWTPASGDWMEAVFDGTNWYCSCHDCTA